MSAIARWLLVLLLTLAACSPLTAQQANPLPPETAGAAQEAPDSAALHAPQAAPPSIPLDLRVARALRAPAFQESAAARGTAEVFRAAALPGTGILAVGMYVLGTLGENPELTDLGLDTGYAILAAGTATAALKLLVGRSRPHTSPNEPRDLRFGGGITGDHRQSFPSAHTAAAFATAAALSAASRGPDATTPAWIAPVAYSAAGIAGLSRLYHDEHWLTDVLAGALVGIVAGLVIGS